MRRVMVHGVLLVLMLIFAFVTWTAEDLPDADDAMVAVWQHDPQQVSSVTYRSAARTIVLERRGAGNEATLWAVQTDSVRPPAQDSVAAGGARTASITEYPVGDEGETMIGGLARLRVIRDLGEATEEKRATYGITDSVPVLTLRLRDRNERALAIGATVLGGGSRYVQDLRGNRIYVVPVSLVRPLEVGGDMLRLTKMQSFEANDVASVTVRAGTAERTMRRRTQGSPPLPVWTPPDSERADEAFGNFMAQIDQLWVARYVPAASADTLQSIVRIEYLDDDRDALGFLELFRTRTATPPVYLMRTGRTVVFGEVYGPLAERVEQDAATLFGQQSGVTDDRRPPGEAARTGVTAPARRTGR
jgi:hypothetical protein